MKYIISNRQHLKIFNKITNYIEDMIDLDEWSLIKAGVGGYEGIYELINQEYETFFVIYMPEYWSEDTWEGQKAKERSPILRIEKDFEEHLTNMFGTLWEEPMKSFVKNNFNIEIKSIGF